MPFGPPCCVMKLRCYVIDHLTHALLRRIHPGNRDEVFIWQNFPARLPTQAALSYEHIENFTKDLEVRRDLGNRARPVNRAHMKRPSNQSLRVTLVLCGKLKATIGQFLALVCNKVSLAGAVFLSLNFTFKGGLRWVGEKVLIIVARIVVCSVSCNHTLHLSVHCKNLVCSNKRVRSEREGQGGGVLMHAYFQQICHPCIS